MFFQKKVSRKKTDYELCKEEMLKNGLSPFIENCYA